MVALPSTYNPSEVEASTGGSSLPEGKYRCIVLGAVEKPTKDGSGSYVEFQHQVTEGPQKGQSIFQRFNFQNANKQAVDIAFAQFKQLAEACGKPNTQNTDDLNNSVVVITYGPQKKNPQYNEVKKVEPASASTDGYVAAPVAEAPAQAAAANTSGKPSWA